VGLTSNALLVLLALATLALPIAVTLAWNRLRGPRPLRVAQRLAALGLAQGVAVLLALIAVNDQYLFFVSWQDAFGSPPAATLATASNVQTSSGPLGGVELSTTRMGTQRDGGRLVSLTVRGDRSHLTGRVLIHLPPGYDAGTQHYPVVELLQGWHAPPESWINNLHVLSAMADAERRGTFPPVIAVMPDINLASPRDVECTNVPGGPQAETWLTTDVRDLVLSQYRALADRQHWGLMGFSTGGYCAAKFALHDPQWYASSVVMSGYFDALKDNTTGDLWGGSRFLRDENAPSWLVTHRPPPAIDLLAFASRYDNESYPSTHRFLTLAGAPLRTFPLIAPRGGHNLKAVVAALPQILGWLGERLSRPTALGPVAVPVAASIPRHPGTSRPPQVLIAGARSTPSPARPAASRPTPSPRSARTPSPPAKVPPSSGPTARPSATPSPAATLPGP
jgi:enterochelin esterase-like enzyme